MKPTERRALVFVLMGIILSIDNSGTDHGWVFLNSSMHILGVAAYTYGLIRLYTL